MDEKFYRTKDGKLVFLAVPSVGIDNAQPCADMHGYQKNGFPTNAPSRIDDENIWASLLGSKHRIAACN